VTSPDFREQLLKRSERAGVTVSESAIDQLERYFTLLAKWSAKINLTALPLNPPTSETFDRLMVEPLAAAGHIPAKQLTWFDLGSGGGSPALPLKIVRPDASLTMVEAKVRKAVFLREAARELRLSGADVENARFEASARARPGIADLVTVRAVRLDKTLVSVARQLLVPNGQLLLFGPDPGAAAVSGFAHRRTVELVPGRRAYLSVYAREVERER
jgi:16S rRNA (guanine527-N7)-methyltransferase